MQSLPSLNEHKKCTTGNYLKTDIVHFPHNNSWNEYIRHPYYDADFLSNPRPVWADHTDPQTIDFGKRFENTNFGEFEFDMNHRPLNPVGPTGVRGRGVLGMWGPNTAADPLVTRWKRNNNGNIMKDSCGKNILQFVSIKRRDNGQYALPGGMVDPGETISQAAKREFGEEALNSLELSEHEKNILLEKLNTFFSNGQCIYEGYVDDPRNTDNAWMVTKCFLWHDDQGTVMNNFNLSAGSDACDVRWTDISSDSKPELYASHADWVNHVYTNLVS